MPARWVTGDELHGADPALRTELEVHQVGYVLGIGCDRRIPTPTGPRRADQVAASLPRHAWQRLSAGAGAKGQRIYEWAWIDHAGREHRDDPHDTGLIMTLSSGNGAVLWSPGCDLSARGPVRCMRIAALQWVDADVGVGQRG